MADVRRYTDQEIADAYTRFRMAIKGQQVNVTEYVLAADYDALGAELAESRAENDRLTTALVQGDTRIAALEAAVRKYAHHLAECDYIVEMLPCTCGLNQVRAALNSSASDTGG